MKEIGRGLIAKKPSLIHPGPPTFPMPIIATQTTVD